MGGLPKPIHAGHLDYGLDRHAGIDWVSLHVRFLFQGCHHRSGCVGSDRFGAGVAYWGVLLGVLVTAFYSFRLLYLVFHG